MADTVALDNDFVEVVRHDLDERSWIEVVPDLVRDPQALFEELLGALEWSQRRRWIHDHMVDEPRLTADHPDIDTAPAPVRALAGRLSEAYGIPYDGAWANLYRDERDSTGWHGDRATCRRERCTVPVLTLGESRRFLVRPAAGGRSTRFTPRSGDLVVMRGRCQLDWRHAVPKQTTPVGPRISLNFRSSMQMTPDAG